MMELIGGMGIDLVLDCAGAENTVSTSAGPLAKGNVLAIVGLFGMMIKVPLFSTVINENIVAGSRRGNYNELAEVIELARQGKIEHSLFPFKVYDINGAIDLSKSGQITGRAVIAP
jgi:alcohol dehydrogenase, propanol-preferring